MKKQSIFNVVIAFLGLALAAQAASSQNTLVVTATNASQNQLLVYDASGDLIQTLWTQGQGGVSGNAGGIEAHENLLAVVNFGSKTVSLFKRGYGGFEFVELIPTVSSPVSVAFGEDHLYILGTTTVESHLMDRDSVSVWSDGVARLLVADGSAAQVGVLPNQLIVTEKSNMIETVGLMYGGVTGPSTAVTNIPANVNTPFGLVTRGNDAYVTIAHANEISLVRNGTVLTTTGSGTQSAPCWLTLKGPFLYSANSPSMSISRYAVYGQKIVQDAAVAAQQSGDTTDIASGAGLVAAIDGSGHLSIYSVDEDGNFRLVKAVAISATANGVAVVPETIRPFQY